MALSILVAIWSRVIPAAGTQMVGVPYSATMTTEIHPTQTRLESTLGKRERDFYIDCLRSVMIALVGLRSVASVGPQSFMRSGSHSSPGA